MLMDDDGCWWLLMVVEMVHKNGDFNDQFFSGFRCLKLAGGYFGSRISLDGEILGLQRLTVRTRNPRPNLDLYILGKSLTSLICQGKEDVRKAKAAASHTAKKRSVSLFRMVGDPRGGINSSCEIPLLMLMICSSVILLAFICWGWFHNPIIGSPN